MVFAKGQALALAFLILPFLNFQPAQAEDGISYLKLENLSESSPAHYQSQTSGTLSLESAQYSSSLPDKPQLDRSLLMRAHLRPELKTERTHSAFEFTAEKYADWGASNYSVRELYWDRSWNDEKSHFTLGRKVEFWSQLDHDWSLGLWQPKAVFDGLRPEEQGLTGIFLKHQEGPFEVLGFASPIFIPTMGPNVREEEGRIVADSRWYREPSSTFVLFHQKRQIVYSLNVPEIRELISKPGGAVRLSYGKNSEGLWVSANAGYKPINSLVVKYDRKLDVSEEGEDTGSVPLYPSVTYHSLWGGDLGYRLGASDISISYLEDRPYNKAPEGSFGIQYANPMKAYSAHAGTKVSMPGFLQPVEFMLSYLRIEGGSFRDYGTDQTDLGAVFAQRFDFYNAAVVQAQFSSSIASKKTISRLSYLRDFEQKGMLASAAMDVYLLKSMALTLGADVLGVDHPDDPAQTSGFLNEFRANDRVYAGISYVF